MIRDYHSAGDELFVLRRGLFVKTVMVRSMPSGSSRHRREVDQSSRVTRGARPNSLLTSQFHRLVSSPRVRARCYHRRAWLCIYQLVPYIIIRSSCHRSRSSACLGSKSTTKWPEGKSKDTTVSTRTRIRACTHTHTHICMWSWIIHHVLLRTFLFFRKLIVLN